MEMYWGETVPVGSPEACAVYRQIAPALGLWHRDVTVPVELVATAPVPVLRGSLRNGRLLDPQSALYVHGGRLGDRVQYDASGEFFVVKTPRVRLELERPPRWK